MPFADILPQQILLQHNPSAGTEVLDIGSGTGMLAEFLKQKGFSLLCIDPSEEMVKRTSAKGLNTVQTNLQDFAKMPTELERIHKWINPNGIFVLAMIEGRGEGVQEGDSKYPRYFSFYTKEEILGLMEKKFECVFESRRQGPTTYLIFIFRKK
uniref:Methyltransferase type 11 domain-containing protein n=1 Tax=Ditylenchus dipsaci TaxID=166011 RepID=A0A915DP49_9BILA